jgi:hypothetical protein
VDEVRWHTPDDRLPAWDGYLPACWHGSGPLLAADRRGVSATASLATASPTKASWVLAANARANAEFWRLPGLTSEAVGISDILATEPIARAADRKVARSPRPASEQRSITRLVSNEAYQRSVVAQFAEAAARSRTARVPAPEANLSKLSTQYDAVARSLGAGVCAQTLAPSG